MSDENENLRNKNLRQIAEDVFKNKTSIDARILEKEEKDVLIHELQVHQIELEIQNEELRIAQMELELVRDNYANLYDFAPVGYVSLDQHNIIKKANLMASQLLGVKRNYLIGTRFTSYLEQCSIDAYYIHNLNVQKSQEKQSCELRMKNRGSGELFYARLESIKARDGSLNTAIIDVTKEKEAEERLVEKSNQLEASNKELESFSYSIAHDLKTPLRAIDGFSRILLKSAAAKLNDDEKSKFEVIQDSVHKMGQLIEDLLSFSRLGRLSISVSDVNVSALVEHAWKECLSSNSSQNVSLRLYPLPHIHADEKLMKQVVMNLLSNALKFTAKINEGFIEVGCRENGKESVFYVKDNGVGFEMDYVHKLFGVFQRLHTDEEYEGTGIGLAIVRRIIQMHGGRVWAEGTVGKGACFYFELPAIQK